MGVFACHKFDEKSLIAVQTQPFLASKIPLWPHPWMGRNVTGLRGPAACARRSAMTKGTSSSWVPCPMKIGQVTAGRAGKNGRALIGPHQGSFCRLLPASGENQGGLEL